MSSVGTDIDRKIQELAHLWEEVASYVKLEIDIPRDLLNKITSVVQDLEGLALE